MGSRQKRTDPNRLVAIRQFRRPQIRKQLKSVLGLMNYHRSFIRGYAELAKSLTDLKSENVPSTIPWTDRKQLAFDTLKDRLCQANQSTHLFEYNSQSGWLQKTNTHKFDIKKN